MTHGIKTAYPALAKPLFYCSKENVAEACEAIVKVQRDYGDRSDRKHARLKYLVNEKGIDWFRNKVCERIDFKTQDVKSDNFESVATLSAGTNKVMEKCFWVYTSLKEESKMMRLLKIEALSKKLRRLFHAPFESHPTPTSIFMILTRKTVNLLIQF